MLEATEYRLSARWHLPENGQPLRKALSLSLVGPVEDPRIEPALHLGRGFHTPFGSGWADVRLFASLSTEGGATEYGVVGAKPHDRIMVMMGMDVLLTPEQTLIKAVPSIAWKLSEGRHLTAQYTKGLHGTEGSEIGLGMWFQF